MLIGELIAASASSMAVVVIIAGAGALCAKYPTTRPLMGPDARRDMGALTIQVTWPCVAIYSVGATMHAHELSVAWDLLLWCLLSIVAGGALSLLAAQRLRLDREFFCAFLLAGTFGNTGSIPMLIMVRIASDRAI
jgi:predicted permease